MASKLEMPTLLMWGKSTDRGSAAVSFSRFDGSEPVTAVLPDEIGHLQAFLEEVQIAVAILECVQQSGDVEWPSIAVWTQGTHGRGRITATLKPGKPSKSTNVELPRDREQLLYFKRRIEDGLALARHIPKDRGYATGGGEDRGHWKFERPTMGSQGTGKRR